MVNEKTVSHECFHCKVKTVLPTPPIRLNNGLSVQRYECPTCGHQWLAVDTGRRVVFIASSNRSQ